MRGKKLLAVLLSAATAASLLAGCGSNEQSKPKSDNKTQTSGEFTKADDPIVYWSMWDAGSNSAIAIQEAIDAYCEASGNEVEVEWKGRDIQTIIGASIDAGENIDIYEDDFQRLSTTFADYALPLDDMAEEYGYYDKSNEALTSAVKGWAGSLKCIPYQGYASGIIYNKAVFEKAGVKEPATWEEFLDVCEKVKAAGYNPIALDSAYTTLNLGYHLARYIGQDAVKDVVDNGKWAETPEVAKMAEDMEELVSKGYFSEYAPGAFPECENEIGYEETAMIVNASWIPDEVTNNTGCDLEWGMFPYPAVEGGVDGTEAMMVGAQGMSVNKNSKNAQAAFELMMFITTGEWDAKIASQTNAIPADPANGDWPEIIKDFKPAFDQATKGYEWACGMENNADMTPVIAEWGNKLFGGDCTAKEFVDGLEAASK
ncbi:ABC transporter substrate-binding protein [Lachnoclostridium sp. An181]|uniref:ABC transporter substrate-binding protein n=1 Tax=Lachnoclostridium sp. An181 TaxID=1965575 RepID=UPI000B3916FF|nr:extracellular solute-binding protein [Lachnoclostridium sp. An181]OUP48083.1 hypothetical protein B5F18_11800 [Lachnoclostridium sp. An181]